MKEENKEGRKRKEEIAVLYYFLDINSIYDYLEEAFYFPASLAAV